MAMTGERTTNALFSAACLALVVLVSLHLWDRWRDGGVVDNAQPVAAESVTGLELDLSEVARRGAEEATVSIVEFSDFECPFCGRFFQANYSEIQTAFVDRGIASYAFVHFPMERIHPRAVRAAEAAECARLQGAFWPMHDMLFGVPRDLSEQRLYDHASVLKLDVEQYRACMESATIPRIDSQRSLAELAGVKSTPTFLIGRRNASGKVIVSRRILGAQPFKVFADAIGEVSEQR